jgi:hypothetical protein
LRAPLATIRRRVFWLRHAMTRRQFSGCPIASPLRRFVADLFGCAIAHPSFDVAIPLADSLLHFFALSPSFASYCFKLKCAPLWHHLIQASRRRAIVTYHRADGRHLIKIHRADGRSSIIAPTGSRRRRASTAPTPTGTTNFKNFAYLAFSRLGHSSIVLCPPFRLVHEDHSLERIPSFDCCILKSPGHAQLR